MVVCQHPLSNTGLHAMDVKENVIAMNLKMTVCMMFTIHVMLSHLPLSSSLFHVVN